MISGDKIIDGKAAAAALRAHIADGVRRFAAQAGRAPGLAVILVGDDPASAVYVRNKGRMTAEVGMVGLEHRLAATIDQQDLLALIDALNKDPAVDGILVQLPLPGQIDEGAVLAAIDPAKDVDGFHIINAGRLATGLTAMAPCTPQGCIMLLVQTLGNLSGMEAIVIGRSNIVGKPMAQLLLREGCTVTIAHSQTRNLERIVRRADIVVAAAGRPWMVKGSWIKRGATVIDVGINRIGTADGKTRLVGDVDTAAAAEHARAITPVPGGVGPMTIAVLLWNTLVAAHAHSNSPPPPAFST